MAYKLIAFDMDGVIFKDINFWIELHKKFGTLDQGTELTKKYLHMDYDRLVEEVVVKLWKGKDTRPYYDLVKSIEYLVIIFALIPIRKKSDNNNTLIA